MVYSLHNRIEPEPNASFIKESIWGFKEDINQFDQSKQNVREKESDKGVKRRGATENFRFSRSRYNRC